MKAIRLCLLLLASTLTLGLGARSSAAVIFQDDFTGVTSLNAAGWYFQNSSGGTAWSLSTSTDSPLSGNVMVNTGGNTPNTRAIKSFSPVTLGLGERLIVRFDHGVDVNTGLNLRVGFTENRLTSNQLNSPMDFEYAYGFGLGSGVPPAATSIGFRDGDSGNGIGSASTTAVRDGFAHSYEFVLERTATGLLMTVFIDGEATTPLQTSITNYTFNYLSFGQSMGGARLDNISVAFVPEASSTLLMGAGLLVLGLPLWLRRRRTRA